MSTARTISTALRARCPAPIGVADQAQLRARRVPTVRQGDTDQQRERDEHHQSGECRPRRDELSDQRAPTAISTHGTTGMIQPGAPRSQACDGRPPGGDLRSAGDHEGDPEHDRRNDGDLVHRCHRSIRVRR